jgi:hypothetical protein
MVARLWTVRRGGVNRRGVSTGGERISPAIPALHQFFPSERETRMAHEKRPNQTFSSYNFLDALKFVQCRKCFPRMPSKRPFFVPWITRGVFVFWMGWNRMEPFHSTVTEPFHPCVRFGFFFLSRNGSIHVFGFGMGWEWNVMGEIVTRLIILNSINYLLNLIK